MSMKQDKALACPCWSARRPASSTTGWTASQSCAACRHRPSSSGVRLMSGWADIALKRALSSIGRCGSASPRTTQFGLSPSRSHFFGEAVGPRALASARPVNRSRIRAPPSTSPGRICPVTRRTPCAEEPSRTTHSRHSSWRDTKWNQATSAAAMVNLAEGARCSRSEQVTQKLFSLLRAQQTGS